MSIPFIDLKTQYHELQPFIQERINRVLDHGQYIMGPEVIELEDKLSAYTGVKHCITVSSGTEALLISLMALGIKSGDEVITTPFTFAATAEVIVMLGAKPIFVDIESDTCNIDARLIEAAITPRTKAIIPVSLYGQPADMDEINAIAARHNNIPVIEDAAQSFGATYKGKKSCNLSAIGCTSFFPSKPLGCYGDGGAIFTNDDDIANISREIRVHGQSRRYFHARVGVSGRMDTIQCAVLLAKLGRFDWEIARRNEVSERYIEALSSISDVQLLSIRPECQSVWAQFTIFIKNRESIRDRLKSMGVPTHVHYPIPLHHQPAYSSYAKSDALSNSILASERVISLPMSADIADSDLDHVLSCVNRLLS
jgi:UDP-2-acetamido-2-deoxy-ribo-hexuluronate aminotransferase